MQPGEWAAAAVGESVMSPVVALGGCCFCFLERAEGARGRKQGLLVVGSRKEVEWCVDGRHPCVWVCVAMAHEMTPHIRYC